ncbi:hypothetical protein NDU88_003493 [Pleurodeles waltl]|uniref:Uncharacterized protein n=1 Tax=Pleurodeles waltl TaxID=8319 RepID=A0AAV7SFS9_PLEWA|nr:hypothetical protein NDU88_003493 [Pleurodeles waltl]
MRGGCAETGAAHLARAISPYSAFTSSRAFPPLPARLSAAGVPPHQVWGAPRSSAGLSAGAAGARAGAPSAATDRRRDALPPPRKALWDHNNKPGVKAPREQGGTCSLDPPAVLNDCEACRVAVNPAANDAPFLGGRWRHLPLRRGPAPNLEYWTARRVHAG